jgi:hypothetical protein
MNHLSKGHMGFKKIANGIRERVYKLSKIVNPIRVKVNDENLSYLWGNNNGKYVIIYPRHCKQEHVKFEEFYQKNKPKIE